jgi:hypothetical protein
LLTSSSAFILAMRSEYVRSFLLSHVRLARRASEHSLWVTPRALARAEQAATSPEADMTSVAGPDDYAP